MFVLGNKVRGCVWLCVCVILNVDFDVDHSVNYHLQSAL